MQRNNVCYLFNVPPGVAESSVKKRIESFVKLPNCVVKVTKTNKPGCCYVEFDKKAGKCDFFCVFLGI